MAGLQSSKVAKYSVVTLNPATLQPCPSATLPLLPLFHNLQININVDLITDEYAAGLQGAIPL